MRERIADSRRLLSTSWKGSYQKSPSPATSVSQGDSILTAAAGGKVTYMSPQKPDSSLPTSAGLRGDSSRDGCLSVLRTARDLKATRQRRFRRRGEKSGGILQMSVSRVDGGGAALTVFG